MAVVSSDYPNCREKCPARTLFTDTNVTKHGFIRKKAGGFKVPGMSKYDQRYVIIYKGWVYYYKDKDSDKPQNMFSLQGFNPWVIPAEEEENSSHPYVFKVFSSKQTRTWYFATEFKDEMETWMEAFKSEILRYNPSAADINKSISCPTPKTEPFTTVQRRSSSWKDTVQHTNADLHVNQEQVRHSTLGFSEHPDHDDDGGLYEPVDYHPSHKPTSTQNEQRPNDLTLSKFKPLPPLPSPISSPSPRPKLQAMFDIKNKIKPPNLRMPSIPISNREPSVSNNPPRIETDSSFDSDHSSVPSYDSVTDNSGPEYLTPLPVVTKKQPQKTKSLSFIPLHPQEASDGPPIPPREPINSTPAEVGYEKEPYEYEYEQAVIHQRVFSPTPTSAGSRTLPPIPVDANKRTQEVPSVPQRQHFQFTNKIHNQNRSNEVTTTCPTNTLQFDPAPNTAEINNKRNDISPHNSPAQFQQISENEKTTNTIKSPNSALQFKLPSFSKEGGKPNLKLNNVIRNKPTDSATTTDSPKWQKPPLKPVIKSPKPNVQTQEQKKVGDNKNHKRSTPLSPTNKPRTAAKPKFGPATLPKPNTNKTPDPQDTTNSRTTVTNSRFNTANSRPPPSSAGGVSKMRMMFENS